MIDEEYALSHEVYVISLNESVDTEGNLPEPVQPAVTSKIVPKNNTPATSDIKAPVNFWIDTIYLKANKESWVAGAWEICVISRSTTWNYRENGNPNGIIAEYGSLRSSSGYQGHQIVKADRGEPKTFWNINYPLNTNWLVDNFNTHPIVYAYVIFEYDAAPAGIRVNASLIPSNPDPNTDQSFISYRSSDDSYGGETVPGYTSNVNYAIYGNVTGLPLNLKSLYYNRYVFRSPSMDFSTEKY